MSDDKTQPLDNDKPLRELSSIREKLLSNPNADGWIRLIELLSSAKEDKRVITSEGDVSPYLSSRLFGSNPCQRLVCSS